MSMGSGLVSIGGPAAAAKTGVPNTSTPGTREDARRSTATAPVAHFGKRVRKRHASLRLSDVPRGAADRAGSLSQVWNGARSRVASSPSEQDRIHLPHASGNRANRARELSNLRHGTGAAHGDRRRSESRAARHDAPVLDQPGADRATNRDCYGQHVVAARVHARRHRRRARRPASTNAVELEYCRGWSSFWRPRWRCGAAGRSSNAGGRRS